MNGNGRPSHETASSWELFFSQKILKKVVRRVKRSTSSNGIAHRAFPVSSRNLNVRIIHDTYTKIYQHLENFIATWPVSELSLFSEDWREVKRYSASSGSWRKIQCHLFIYKSRHGQWTHTALYICSWCNTRKWLLIKRIMCANFSRLRCVRVFTLFWLARLQRM